MKYSKNLKLFCNHLFFFYELKYKKYNTKYTKKNIFIVILTVPKNIKVNVQNCM